MTLDSIEHRQFIVHERPSLAARYILSTCGKVICVKVPLSPSTVAFALIGAIGFCIDGGLLTLLSQAAGINVYISRLFSFAAATLVTWMLNRKYAFNVGTVSARQKQKEYFCYLAVQLGGALLNLGIFSLLISVFSELKNIPIVPLAVGAFFGLIFTYSGSRYWVFPPSSRNRDK